MEVITGLRVDEDSRMLDSVLAQRSWSMRVCVDVVCEEEAVDQT